MRVRMLKPLRLYWNYAMRELKAGQEIVGDLARHLAHNAPAGHVKVLDAPPEPAPEPAPASGPEPAAAPADEPPVDGTAETLMTWVGDDPGRARQAMDAEHGRDRPRATVLKRLAALIEE